MKTILQVIIAAVLIQLTLGCGGNNTPNEPKHPNKKLIVLAYDISKSNDNYAILNEDHLKELFSRIAFKGGGKFYAILIKKYSNEQDLFEYTIPAFDTLELRGNPYQVKRRLKENRKILEPFNIKQAEFVQKAKEAIIKPKTEDFTDLTNAMKLVEGTFNQSMYSNKDKHLIIISDGINDLPPNNGEDKIETTVLEDVTVVLVRPTRTQYVKGKSVTITNSIQDALMNL